jgi:hypothetical protein
MITISKRMMPLVLLSGTAYAAQAEEAVSNSKAPPHTVQTNIPGVFAYTQPPAAFNVRTASAAELAAWGYPPRPDASKDSAEYGHWLEVVNPAAKRVIPDLVRHEGVYHRPVANLSVNVPGSRTNAPITASSENWSGLALLPASGGQPISSVSGRWTVPTVKQAPGTCSGGWDYSSQWVGIGGFNDGFLFQAGSAASVYCDVGNNIPEYFPWIEWLPQSELVLYKNASTSTLYPFAPGDYLIVTVSATNWSGGVSTTGNLSFQDVTQGWTVTLTASAASLGGSEVTGQSGEWIVERTEVNGAFATLPDYIVTPWWLTKAEDLGSVFHYPGLPNTATAYNITMVDDSNAPVSFVNLAGQNSLWFFPEGSATK